MKPISFENSTQVLIRPAGMSEQKCGPLPVYSDGQQCISCWRPSLRERVSMLLFGRVWLYVLSGKTQPPVSLKAKRNVFSFKGWA